MSAIIIDGKEEAKKIRIALKKQVKTLNEQQIFPCLAVILVGEDPASAVYVRNKEKGCDLTGIRSIVRRLPAETEQQELLNHIEELNNDDTVHGILVQMPLPGHIDERTVIAAIHPDKDVDGFHVINSGRLFIGDTDCLMPCTPKGIIHLIKSVGIDLGGKHAVVIGRSNIVGKPMAIMLLGENATVTICHSRTKNLSELVKQADVVVAAVGRANIVTADMVKPGAVVIDVGMNRLNDRLVGDVDYEAVKEVAGYITPVPGGVGPMTIAMLLKNTVQACLYGK